MKVLGIVQTLVRLEYIFHKENKESDNASHNGFAPHKGLVTSGLNGFIL